MKKLLISVDPEIYKKYKGLQRYLDAIIVEISKFNFGGGDCDLFMTRLIDSIQDDSLNISILRADEFTYDIIHKKLKIELGSITRINLL